MRIALTLVAFSALGLVTTGTRFNPGPSSPFESPVVAALPEMTAPRQPDDVWDIGGCSGASSVDGGEITSEESFEPDDAFTSAVKAIESGRSAERLRALLSVKSCEWARLEVSWMSKWCADPKSRTAECDELPKIQKQLDATCVGTAGVEREAASAASELVRRLEAPRVVILEEKAVPEDWRWQAPERPPAREIPELENEDVVFASPKGPREFAVSVSQDVDPRGEVSMGGYWLHVREESNGPWHGPYYLGFGHQFPYVVQSASRVPSFDGDRIQIEVERREVDEKSITFPPVALRAKEVVKNLYLAIHLADVTRDTDGDGLTDLLEEKLLLDPSAPDTDGDGLSDGADPLPLQRGDADPGDRVAALENAVLASVMGTGRPVQQSAAATGEGSTMSAPASPFAGGEVLFLSGSVRLAHSAGVRAIAIPDALLDGYRRKFGTTYPVEPLRIVFDATKSRAFVQYSFGWHGGSFFAKWRDGEWVLESRGSWIT